MTNPVCPYCRGPIVSPPDEQVVCDGCDTPHHRDCFEENCGCTVFGCRCAPADEPKVHVSQPEFTNVQRPTGQQSPFVRSLSYSTIGLTQAAPAGVSSSQIIPTAAGNGFEHYKSKMTFVLLGVLLGALGAHNFYAGNKKKAILQLCITVLTLGYAAPMSWIWAIIDVCTVERDSEGIQFKS